MEPNFTFTEELSTLYLGTSCVLIYA